MATVRNQGCFPKTQFHIDLDAGCCTCPAGRVSRTFRVAKRGGGVFRFAAAVCAACPLRAACVRGRHGRSVQVHPQEPLLQRARAFQASPAFTPYRALRQVAEHRLARLVQLGLRQARYRGVAKTLFQAYMAATVANLTLLAARFGPVFARFLVRTRPAALLALQTARWRAFRHTQRCELTPPLPYRTTLTAGTARSNWPVFGLDF